MKLALLLLALVSPLVLANPAPHANPNIQSPTSLAAAGARQHAAVLNLLKSDRMMNRIILSLEYCRYDICPMNFDPVFIQKTQKRATPATVMIHRNELIQMGELSTMQGHELWRTRVTLEKRTLVVLTTPSITVPVRPHETRIKL